MRVSTLHPPIAPVEVPRPAQLQYVAHVLTYMPWIVTHHGTLAGTRHMLNMSDVHLLLLLSPPTSPLQFLL